MYIYLALAAIFVPTIAIYGSIWIRQILRNRRFTALATAFGAASAGRRFRLEDPRSGATVAVSLDHGFSDEAATLQIEIAGRGPWIELRPETLADRIGRRIGLNRTVSSGDEGFDRAIYVDSDADDDVVRSVVSRQAVRRAAVEIISLGYRKVELSTSGAAARVTCTHPRREHYDPQRVRRIVELLFSLHSPAAPVTARSEASVVSMGVGFLGVCLAIVACFALIMGSFVAYGRAKLAYPPIGNDLYYTGLLGGLGVIVLVLPGLWVMTRGHSDSFGRLLGLLLLLALNVPGYALAALVTLNGTGDASPTVSHQSKVQDCHNPSKSYERDLRLAPLDGVGEPVDVPMPSDACDKASRWHDVIVKTGRGRFGWTWVRAIEKAP